MKKGLVFSALSLGLALTACGSTPAPVPTEKDPPVTEIVGRVTAGSGAGSVTLRGSQGQLAAAPVDAEGNFKLALPGAERLAADLKTADQVLSDIGCTGTVNSSVPAARGYGAAALGAERSGLKEEVYAANINIQYLPLKGKLSALAWLYVDQATHLTGSVNCSKLIGNARPVNLTLDIQARPGWNVVSIYAEGLTSLDGNMTTVFSGPTVWRTAGELRAQIPF